MDEQITMRRRLGDLEVGDKFIKGTKMYLIIDFKVSDAFLNVKFPSMLCALDLNTYKVLCFDKEDIVDFESDNVFI